MIMKIIQITPVKNGEFTNFFGLTEDNKVYTYSWKTGNWKQFKEAKKKA